MEYADQCRLPSAKNKQEFSVADIESCHFLKETFNEHLTPYSNYYYGEKKGSDYLAFVMLTCDSSIAKEDLEYGRNWTSKFACLQDSAASDCDNEATVKVVKEFLSTVFPEKSRYER